MREGFMPVAGGSVWYGISGEEWTRLPLVILHGGPGVPHDYLEPLVALSDERPVIRYDQRGCGRSTAEDDPAYWTVEYFVDELALLVEQLGLSRFHLLGQSWGTALAVEFCLKFPAAGVASLTLAAPCLDAARWCADQQRAVAEMPAELQRIIHEAEENGCVDTSSYQSAVDEFFRRHVCRLEPWPECFQRSVEGMNQRLYHYMWGASEFSVDGTLKNYSVVARLGALSMPVWLTGGEFDEATPESVAFYAAAIPRARMTIFPGTSHVHHLENTPVFLAGLRHFLLTSEGDLPG